MANHVPSITRARCSRCAGLARRTDLRPELAAFFTLGPKPAPSLREHGRGILQELARQQGTD